MAYNQNVFKERLNKLQKDKKLKNIDIVKILSKKYHIKDSDIGQNYSNYKNGKRTCPYDVLFALAEILNTTTDYLLGLEDEPRHAKSVHQTTGLSNKSVDILIDYRKKNPEIIKMLDALIFGSSSGVPVLKILFRQFWEDYSISKHNTSKVESKEHDARILKLYVECRNIMFKYFSDDFDQKFNKAIQNDINVKADSGSVYKNFLHNLRPDFKMRPKSYAKFMPENGKKDSKGAKQ